MVHRSEFKPFFNIVKEVLQLRKTFKLSQDLMILVFRLNNEIE